MLKAPGHAPAPRCGLRGLQRFVSSVRYNKGSLARVDDLQLIASCRLFTVMWRPAARWKSTMVAVKVVEHSHIPKSNSNSPNPGFDKTDPAGAEARVAREMLLSTSISHPNVIATYKICTIRVGTVPDSGFPRPTPDQASLFLSSHRYSTECSTGCIGCLSMAQVLQSGGLQATV